ncbi:MAG: enoyl-CoA hydratase-related protein, partial [Desulfobacteraceae bacterium]|nr:enoyl-CoA hydratase-related protein [Desulfobacteraceae bacterium]
LMLERFTGSRICGRLMLEGSLIKAENAISLGLIDDICPLDGVMERAVQKARQLMEIPGETFAAMKDNHLAAVREKYLARIGPRTEQFMDLWFAKETQKRLAKAMEKF